MSTIAIAPSVLEEDVAVTAVNAPHADSISARLSFRDRGTWSPLPEWCRFLIQVGEYVGSRSDNTPLVLGLSLPARDYAAALVALGTGYSRAPLAVETTAEEHFDFLMSLPEGVSVRWTKDGRVKNGKLAGSGERMGQRYLRIQVQERGAKGGGLTISCYPHQALGVELTEEEVKLTTGTGQGKPVGSAGYLLTFGIPHVHPEAFTAQTRLECAIVGVLRRLKPEVVQQPFGVTVHGRMREGRVQDIVRIRDFLRPEDHYRTDILPERSKGQALGGHTPHVVVFDGALGFLKLHDKLAAQSKVVLLDRADNRSQDAAALLNQIYVSRREDTWEAPDYLTLPAGTEIMGFTTRPHG